ncbi:MAG: class I SAM-dependent methyltransferase, partial [Ilumatobacteraceae bacterium]
RDNTTVSTAREHWDTAYDTKSVVERSWSSDAETSVRLITRYAPTAQASVVDVGGGASPLAGRLVAEGYLDVTVVDISQRAIEEARTSLPMSMSVTWVCADVRTWEPGRTFDVWHDRAVLHFLSDSAERAAYARLARRTVNGGGLFIVSSFAEDGPETCSGLPVARATHEQLSALFDEGFHDVERFRETHITPWGSEQPFNWLVLRRYPT